MARQTSIETYHKIRSEGLLSARRLQVYQTVFKYGPMTSAEAFQIMNENSPLKNLTQSRARFTELREMGVLSEVGSKQCGITGHRAILWDVTDRLPEKHEKKDPEKTVIESLKKKCALLEYEVDILRQALVSLVNESSGLASAHGDAIRADSGNTNLECLENRIKKAKQVLIEIKGTM